jgi:hypothetical protein
MPTDIKEIEAALARRCGPVFQSEREESRLRKAEYRKS